MQFYSSYSFSSLLNTLQTTSPWNEQYGYSPICQNSGIVAAFSEILS